MTEQLRGRRRTSLRYGPVLAIVVALTLVVAACGGDSDNESSDKGGSNTTAAGGGGEGTFTINTDDCATDPEGVTVEGDTIKLGTSLPQSGLYSAFKEILAGETAYIEYLNEQGGVEVAGKKYKIELVSKDDGYDASKTVTNVQGLIDNDKVFGLFNVVGTKNNAAIRDTVNDQCVPNLFAATGSPLWGNKSYPWLEGTFLVPYPLEMNALVGYLKQNKPNATIAVLRADDDFGKAYSQTLASLVKGTDLKVVKEETYNPENADTKTQITSLASSNADVLVVAATLLGCPDALKNTASSGWKPITYMSGTCTSKTLMALAGDAGNNVLSVSPLMDPANPKYANDSAMTLYKQKVAQYEPSADPTNGIVAYGWTAGAMLEYLLKKSPELNRLSVMETARTTEDVTAVGLQLPGSSWTVNGNDWFLGEDYVLVQYSSADGYFKELGAIEKQNGVTEKITPPDLINAK